MQYSSLKCQPDEVEVPPKCTWLHSSTVTQIDIIKITRLLLHSFNELYNFNYFWILFTAHIRHRISHIQLGPFIHTKERNRKWRHA